MKITEATLAKAIMLKADLEFYQNFNVKGWEDNPYHFAEDYLVVGKSWLWHWPAALIGQEIRALRSYHDDGTGRI